MEKLKEIIAVFVLLFVGYTMFVKKDSREEDLKEKKALQDSLTRIEKGIEERNKELQKSAIQHALDSMKIADLEKSKTPIRQQIITNKQNYEKLTPDQKEEEFLKKMQKENPEFYKKLIGK